MSTIVTVTLTVAAIALFAGALHINHLRYRLDKAEFCYDIATRALVLMSDRETRDEINNLSGDKWIKAAVEMAREQFEEDMEEDEDDE